MDRLVRKLLGHFTNTTLAQFHVMQSKRMYKGI